jgi:hypothetical protein
MHVLGQAIESQTPMIKSCLAACGRSESITRQNGAARDGETLELCTLFITSFFSRSLIDVMIFCGANASRQHRKQSSLKLK